MRCECTVHTLYSVVVKCCSQVATKGMRKKTCFETEVGKNKTESHLSSFIPFALQYKRTLFLN